MDFILTLKLKPTPNPVLQPRIPSTARVFGIEIETFHKFGYQILYVCGKRADKMGQLDHSHICPNSHP